uniref:protein phosphatase 1 regulatory subunit 26 isoform X2 n=1 Tax=Pristiophorus japonicus TaxID=55135 RepID=UPI00398F827B
MFLMNLAPVSAVQTDWQPFGASQSFSLPISFSDPGEEFSAVGRAVNVNVQMIIENLQPHDSPCAMNNDPGANAQTNAVEKRPSKATLDGASVRVLKGPAVEELKTGYPGCALGAQEPNSGRCVADSDSDESIDRDIEEAIQEYLKKKTEDSCLIPKGGHKETAPPGSRPASEDPAPTVSNGAALGGEAVPAQLGLGFVNIDPRGVGPEATAATRCSSPSSVSSNDSFELSIQAEIERFLQDKRDKGTGGPDNKPAPGGRPERRDNLVKVRPKVRKRGLKPSTGNQAHPGKPALINADTQVGSSKPAQLRESRALCRTEKGSEGNPKGNKKLASEKRPTAMQSFKEIYKSSNVQCSVDQAFSDPRTHPITAGAELSDSSSDDGIEEAIQRYQLEQKKGKTEDNALVLSLLPHKPPCTQKCADSASDPCLCGAKSTQKETLQATLSRKGKHCGIGSGEFKAPCPLNLSDTDSSDQSSDDFVTQRERKTTDSRCSGKKRFQAETPSGSSPKREGPLAAKAQPAADGTVGVAPSGRKEHTGSSSQAASECPTADSRQAASSSDSENSSVDSSDSIEKEIQRYLALKANQSGGKPEGGRARGEPDRTLPPELNSLNDSPSLFSSSSSSSLLSQKGSQKNNVGTDHELGKEELRGSQPQETTGPPVAAANNGTVALKIKPKAGLSDQGTFHVGNVWLGRTVNRDGEASPPTSWAAKELSRAKPVRDAWQTDEKSSSLDSDEDLDTATKDLLKTRKKLGKRPRDPKNRCKKRVRFTGAEVLTYSEQSTGIGDQAPRAAGEGLAASHGPLKSCLSKSSKAACRSYLDFKSKGNKRAGESSESESSGKVARIGKPKAGLSGAAPSSVARGPTGRTARAGDSSSADSDDGIEQEILRFLAEKARVNSGSEERLRDQDEVQGFTEQGGESRLSEVAAQGRTVAPVTQQAGGSRSAGTKGSRRLAEEATAGYSRRGTEWAGAESKAEFNGQDLLQDVHSACRTQHQTDRRQVVGESLAASQTETRAGVLEERLQVGSTDCPGKGTDNCPSGWPGDIPQDKGVNTLPDSCLAQGKGAAGALETTRPWVREQSVQYTDPGLLGTGQLLLKPVRGSLSEKTVHRLKLWSDFPAEPFGDTVPIDGGEGTCREAECPRDSQSGLWCSTDPSSRAADNAHSHVGRTGSDKTRCKAGGDPGQPLGSLVPPVSLGPYPGGARGLPCTARQEQSDHNYQSGMRSEAREQRDARLSRPGGATQRLCEVTGPSPSPHEEGAGRIEQRGRSVGPETAAEMERAEGVPAGEAGSQSTGRAGSETPPAPQWQSLSQALSGAENVEPGSRGTGTGEAAEGKGPDAFYDDSSEQSEDEGRVDTGRAGLQGQAEVMHLSSCIDPGLNIEPYIILSPEKLLCKRPARYSQRKAGSGQCGNN